MVAGILIFRYLRTNVAWFVPKARNVCPIVASPVAGPKHSFGGHLSKAAEGSASVNKCPGFRREGETRRVCAEKSGYRDQAANLALSTLDC